MGYRVPPRQPARALQLAARARALAQATVDLRRDSLRYVSSRAALADAVAAADRAADDLERWARENS